METLSHARRALPLEEEPTAEDQRKMPSQGERQAEPSEKELRAGRLETQRVDGQGQRQEREGPTALAEDPGYTQTHQLESGLTADGRWAGHLPQGPFFGGMLTVSLLLREAWKHL